MLSTLVWSLVPKSLTSFLVTSIAVYLVYRWFELKYRYRTLPKPPGLPFVGHLFLFIGNPFRPDGKKVHQREYESFNLLNIVNVLGRSPQVLTKI